MSRDTDPADQLAREVFASPEPGPGDRRYAERRLSAAIDAASGASRRIPAAPAVAAAFVVAVFVSAWILLTPSRPATAALEEIAAAIEVGPVDFAADDEFLYVDRSMRALVVTSREALGEVGYPGEHFAYVLVLRRETWYRADGAQQMRTTVEPPQFLREGDRQVYYAAGLEEADRVGETFTETFPEVDRPDWPADPRQLDPYIQETKATGRGLSDDIEYLDVALDVVRDAPAAPQIRAEALRLIGRLSAVELVEETTDGTATFRTRYVLNDVDTEHVFSIDSDGHLVRDKTTALSDASQLGLPAGTTMHETTLNARSTVRSLSPP